MNNDELINLVKIHLDAGSTELAREYAFDIQDEEEQEEMLRLIDTYAGAGYE